MHNSFFMYLRSKDDNLILLTTGVLINILINKEIDLQLLHRVNMLPKSRLSEFLQICD